MLDYGVAVSVAAAKPLMSLPRVPDPSSADRSSNTERCGYQTLLGLHASLSKISGYLHRIVVPSALRCL